jgi:hypothetical protein
MFWRPDLRASDQSNTIHGPALKSSRLKKMFLPVRIEEAVGPHNFTGTGGMDKKIIAHIDADVRVFFPELIKKHEIALPHVPVCNGQSASPEFPRAVGHFHARGRVAVSNQSAAIEPRRVASPVTIRPSDLG